jgi:MraZ protein
MFIGEHQHNLDEKGRLQVPAKWRSALAEGAVITKGFDGSLSIYPMSVWQEKAEQLASLPQSDPTVRGYVRQVLAGAVDVTIDGSGRLSVPSFLRDYAALSKEVVVNGVYRSIEIWSTERWSTYASVIDQNSEQLQQSLSELGL